MPQLPTFWTGPPTRVRVYPCPACQELISIDARSCRFCHEPVDVKAAEQLWVENRQTTTAIATAITRADTYSYLTRALIPITAFTLWRISKIGGGLAEIWIICQLLALSYGAQWLSHNSSLVTTNADYVEAVVKVKKAMLGWVILLLAQVAAYLILNGAPDWNSILDLFVLE